MHRLPLDEVLGQPDKNLIGEVLKVVGNLRRLADQLGMIFQGQLMVPILALKHLHNVFICCFALPQPRTGDRT
jgi:hypothetical protein